MATAFCLYLSASCRTSSSIENGNIVSIFVDVLPRSTGASSKTWVVFSGDAVEVQVNMDYSIYAESAPTTPQGPANEPGNEVRRSRPQGRQLPINCQLYSMILIWCVRGRLGAKSNDLNMYYRQKARRE